MEARAEDRLNWLKLTILKNHPVSEFCHSFPWLGPKLNLNVNTNTFMLWWIIVENIILICLPLFPYDPSNWHLLQQNYFNRRRVSLLILIYFLHTPLHGLAFYGFNYPLCLFPSCFCIIILIKLVLLFNLCILYTLNNSQLKLLYKLTTEHTLHSRVKLPII